MTTPGDQPTPETRSEIPPETRPKPAPEATPETAPDSAPEPVVIAGAPSQMLARLLVGVIVFGVVVSGAYIVTRRSEAPAPAPAPAPVLVELPVVTPLVAAAPQVEAKSAAVTAASDISPEETKGHTFLQVGAVDRTEATKYVRELGAKSFTARIAEGPQPHIARILIGPISGPDLIAMQSRLTEAGVASFQKSY